MRTFIVSLVIFLILLGCIIGNFFFIRSTTDNLAKMTASLPDANETECKDRVAELREFWERRRDLISLSVSYTDLNQCGSLLAALDAFSAAGDSTHFNAAKLQLLDALDELSRLEAFSIGNLL